MAIPVLKAHRTAALDELPAMRERRSRILWMPELGDRHCEQLVPAPAQDRRRSRIDVGPMVGKIRNADEVFRDAPKAIAFARALRDLLLQRLVQLLKGKLGALALGDVDVRADETEWMSFGITLDFRSHGNPADLSVARTDDAVLRPVFARVAANRANKGLLVLFPVFRMNPANPILMGLVRGLRRQAVDFQIFGRASVFEAVGKKHFDA